MKVSRNEYKVGQLAEAFTQGALLRNAEYQRGEAWSALQRAAFIDSLFRKYPVPPLFLHRRNSAGLGSSSATRHEIIDGQQRLLAMSGYVKGNFPLLPVDRTSRLRLPESLRRLPAPWAGKTFAELSKDLQQQLIDSAITTYEIDADEQDDSVRDLFIRLQSGTALSRQQIRDAWPGNLGPFIEQLAGKLSRLPRHRLFAVIDKRGQRLDDEDQRDRYVGDRQTCAQLLRVFIARERDPFDYPSVSAKELDAMYHEYTDFEVDGDLSRRFREVLDLTADIFECKGTAKRRRLDVTCVLMFVQDMTRSRSVKFDRATVARVAQQIKLHSIARYPGKSTSGRTLEMQYGWWRTHVLDLEKLELIRLDPRRDFDAVQKAEIRLRCNGRCALCGNEPTESEAEYDHYPIPYRDGGRTEVNNGRLVCAKCHPRGRPVKD